MTNWLVSCRRKWWPPCERRWMPCTGPGRFIDDAGPERVGFVQHFQPGPTVRCLAVRGRLPCRGLKPGGPAAEWLLVFQRRTHGDGGASVDDDGLFGTGPV